MIAVSSIECPYKGADPTLQESRKGQLRRDARRRRDRAMPMLALNWHRN